MSRCFPYPPPGYEPRPISEHDLLKKERDKGKKHTKENGRGKGERKGKDRRKRKRKGKDRDHKKLKREKHRGRRNHKDRDKDNRQSPEQETQKTVDFDNKRPKDIKCLDELVAQKVNSNSVLIPGSSNGFGATASKEKEKSLSRTVKKSGHAPEHYHGMIQKNGSNARTKKKGTRAGVGSQTRMKNAKDLQVGPGEKHSSRRHSSKVKQMKRSSDVDEPNKMDDMMHLACLDEQKFTCDDIKKRKELNANGTLHGNGVKTTKSPRMSPTSIACVNEKASLHSQGTAPFSSQELVGTNTQELDWHKPQDGYSNGTAGTPYLAQQKVSVSSSVYDSKYLSQLLSIPPREGISECIDQGWLFSEECTKRNTESLEAAESHQVWPDAQLIDTADVVALPYVVPL